MMKYKNEFNQSLIAVTMLFFGFTILQAQEERAQPRQNPRITTQSANATDRQKRLKNSFSERNEIVRSIVPINKCTVSKSAKGDRELDCLKGNVHVVRSEFAGVVRKDGQYVKDWVSQERTVIYYERGNKIESLVYGFDLNRNKKIDSRVVYKFNRKGTATGWEDYADGRPMPTKSVYTFDKKGNRIKEVVTQADGYVRAELALIYDSEGNNIEKIYDDKNAGTNRYREINEYEKGNLIQTAFYNKAGLIISKRVLTYENGNMKEAVGYSLNADNKLVRANRVSMSYDTAGNLIEEVIYDKGHSIKNKFVYGYDKQGNIISTVEFGSDGKVTGKTTMTLEFDSQGNWIRYITSYSNSADGTNARESHSQESRIITYY